jgi:hypothetical protein
MKEHWKPDQKELDELHAYAKAHGVTVHYDSSTGYLDIEATNPDKSASNRKHSCLVPNFVQAKLCIDRF